MKQAIKSLVIKLIDTPPFSDFIRRFIALYASQKDIVLLSLKRADREVPLKIIRNIKTESAMQLSDLEALQIYTTAQKTEKINGDVAEVGVYKGGSAKLIRNATQKTLHLFDTFAGLPELSQFDDPNSFKKGDCYATIEEVAEYLKGLPNLHIYKGLFPGTAGPIREKKFSFVHIDVDEYEHTRTSLEFFYPRMSSGGAIISHDYPGYPGVKKAVDEFFADKPEFIINTYGTDQALIIKV